MSTSLPVPPGFSPPFAAVTATNRSGVVYVSTIILLLFVFVSTLTRLWKVFTDGRRAEDYFTLASALFFAILTALSLHGCSVGLGSSITTLSSEQQRTAQIYLYAAVVIAVPALGVSRTSMMQFFCPLFKSLNTVAERSAKWMTRLALLWTISTTLVLALVPLSPVWKFVLLRRWFYTWVVLEVLGCGFEIACVVYAFLAYGYIQKKREANAGQLVFILCLPVVVIVITVVRLATFDQSRFKTDPTLYAADFVAWLTTQAGLSIIFSNIMRAAKILMGYYTGVGFFAVQDWTGETSNGSQFRSGNPKASRTRDITLTQTYSVTRSNTGNVISQRDHANMSGSAWVKHQQRHRRGRSAEDSISINSETRIVKPGDGKSEGQEGDPEHGSQQSLSGPGMGPPQELGSRFTTRN